MLVYLGFLMGTTRLSHLSEYIVVEKTMQRLEDYPQTDEGGVAFVRDMFKSMGGNRERKNPHGL